MKFKIEYLILIIIIAALGSYLALHTSDRTLYELPELPAIEAKNLTRIEIAKADGTFAVVKKDGTWHIEPGDYTADGKKADDMVGALANLAVTALVSESESYERYGLGDDRRISVKAWTGDALARDIQIGKTAPTYNHTFVRLAGSDKVFHARGAFRRTFDLSRDDLRDKKVMAFDAGTIEEITITRKGTTERFTRTLAPPAEGTAEPEGGEGKTAWKNAAGDALDGPRMEAFLADLASLECESFLEESAKEEFTDPVVALTLKGAGEYRLTIYPKDQDADENVPAVSSEAGEPFLLAGHRVESLREAIDGLTGTAAD